MEYTWMRKLTPVTVSAMTAASGSQRRSTPISRGPMTAHVNRRTGSDRPPRGSATRSTKAAPADTKAMATAADPITPAARPNRRPAARSTRAPASGAARMSGISCTISPLEQGQIVDVGAVLAAEDRNDDGQSDGDLRGGDDHHEQDDDVPLNRSVHTGERDEGDVDGVEHELDAHEQHERVASHQ